MEGLSLSIIPRMKSNKYRGYQINITVHLKAPPVPQPCGNSFNICNLSISGGPITLYHMLTSIFPNLVTITKTY